MASLPDGLPSSLIWGSSARRDGRVDDVSLIAYAYIAPMMPSYIRLFTVSLLGVGVGYLMSPLSPAAPWLYSLLYILLFQWLLPHTDASGILAALPLVFPPLVSYLLRNRSRLFSVGLLAAYIATIVLYYLFHLPSPYWPPLFTV